MAVDFSTRATDLDSRIEPSATELRPVDRSGEIDALQQIGRGVGVGARTLATYFQNKKTLDENSRNGKFAYDLSALQDAEAQGVPTGEIRIRGRARYQQELANNPGDVDKINRAYSQWLNNSGYNNIATPAIQKAQIEQKQIDAAVQNGFLSANDVNDPSKVKSATENLENFQTTVRQLEMDQKQLANQKSRNDLTASERARLDAQTKDNAILGLQKVAASSLPYWRTQYDNIKAAAAKAGSEQERQQIIKQGILQLDQDYAQRTAALSGDSLAVDQGKVDQILGPVKGLIDSYKKELSGEYDTDMFDRMSKSAEAQAKMQVWTNMTPKARELVAMSQIFKEGAVALTPQLNAEAANYFAQNWGTGKPDANGNVQKPADILQPTAEDQSNVKAYLNSVKTAVTGVQNKTLSDNAAKEVNEQLNAIFKGVDVFGNSSESAKEFQPVIDFLADGTIGQYLSSGGKVDPAVMAKAQQVIADGYQKQVIPIMKEELGRTYNQAGLGMPGKGIGQSMKLGKFEDIVEPVFQNGQVSFKFKDGLNLQGTNGPFGDLLLKSLNSGAFSKVFNKMVKANAHAQGNTDYQKSYDELAPLVFPGQEQSNQSGGPDERSQLKSPDGTNIDLASLVEVAASDPAFSNVSASTLEGDVRDIAQAVDIGETGTGDYNTLLGHTNRTGGRFDDANITDKSVNDLIAFSDGSGPYGMYTKAKLGKVATPMGRYQIVGKTLKTLKNEMGLTGDEKFTPELQDRMFLTLLKRRGYEAYKRGELSREDFIASLQNEWEGLSNSRKAFSTLTASL